MQNGLACKVKGLHNAAAQLHTHTTSLSLIIHYTRNQTFKKGIVVDSLVLLSLKTFNTQSCVV